MKRLGLATLVLVVVATIAAGQAPARAATTPERPGSCVPGGAMCINSFQCCSGSCQTVNGYSRCK
jgi:hypothetical protein